MNSCDKFEKFSQGLSFSFCKLTFADQKKPFLYFSSMQMSSLYMFGRSYWHIFRLELTRNRPLEVGKIDI